ncbi:4-(cytidine 5'-diphospho)-2-C-methyl-D-erythritol kinase [Clostridia bacterium]|nr:4-(cytidine 5'-diphospho)-2-C-methyl-D-erythritol kinase [Clostridia bacterium]
MKELRELAYAKINLSIDVLGVRPDGYHEVEMVMQSVDLCDELILSLRDDEQIHLDCEKAVTSDPEDNLVLQTARLLKKRYSVKKGADLTLLKRIPVQAGLGGGSSDAAATLRGLNHLWKLELVPEELEHLAAELGSDIPYCIQGGTAFAFGRGEKVRKIPSFGRWNMLLIKPSFGLSTPKVYREFDKREHKVRYASRAIENELRERKRIRFSRLKDFLHNDLQQISCGLSPEVGQLILSLENRGAVALMCGSGPTVMGIFEDGKDREKACKDYLDAGYRCYLVQTISY